jgi:hypothetical protein
MNKTKHRTTLLVTAVLLCLPALGVQATTLTNWARAGTATQSSTLNNSINPVASKAIDGNTSGAWGDGSLTHTATGDAGEWWQVDLGETKPAGHIHLWFREDCFWQRNENLRIVLCDSTNVISHKVLWETNNTYLYPMTPRDIGFDLPAGLSCRVVFIEHVSGSPEVISLAEVEVFNQPLIELTNYASSVRGGVATSSSVYNSDPTLFGPEQAIDGNHMGLSGAFDATYNWGYSAPDSGNDPLPWWRVDLAAPQTIGSGADYVRSG